MRTRTNEYQQNHIASAKATMPRTLDAVQNIGQPGGLIVASIVLTQEDANALLAMEKCRADDQKWDYPGLGGSICVPLISRDKRENFILDVSRSGKIALKGKYQNRARQTIILVRYDFGGAPHRNPDDEEIDCPHLHIYREGYGHKWAYPIPSDKFTDLADPWKVLTDFMKYCNITVPPIINRGLFL